jgi:hypothetical protein
MQGFLNESLLRGGGDSKAKKGPFLALQSGANPIRKPLFFTLPQPS